MKSKPKCLYCNGYATTKDHVPSKNLLEKPYPSDLITIDACNSCNKSYSLDEEYFLNVLVTLSISPNLVARTEPGGSIYRSRQRSQKLYNRLVNSLVVGEDGRTYFKPESQRIKRVIEKYAFGLFYYRYQKVAALSYFNCVGFYPFQSEETRPAEIFMLTHSERFRPKKWNHIQEDVFSYIVVRDWRRGNKLTMIFHIHNTAWAVIEIPTPRGRKKYTSQRSLFDLI